MRYWRGRSCGEISTSGGDIGGKATSVAAVQRSRPGRKVDLGFRCPEANVRFEICHLHLSPAVLTWGN
jgi:hypothetical protein